MAIDDAPRGERSDDNRDDDDDAARGDDDDADDDDDDDDDVPEEEQRRRAALFLYCQGDYAAAVRACGALASPADACVARRAWSDR